MQCRAAQDGDQASKRSNRAQDQDAELPFVLQSCLPAHAVHVGL
jgi:hypothetical protein